MTFTATGEPSNIPPRVHLELDTDVSGATFHTLTVSRDGVPIRRQPPVGVEETEAYDYEMPFGSSLNYVASGTYLPFVSPEFTEAWASLASWTQDPGASWSVAGGVASSTTSGATLTRTTAAPMQRVRVVDPGSIGLVLASADAEDSVIVSTTADGLTSLAASPEYEFFSTSGSGDYTVTIVDQQVTVTGDDGWTLESPYSGADLVSIAFVSGAGESIESSTFSTTGNADRIAVASGGDIYALDIAAKLVRRFNSAGVFQNSWSTTGVPSGIAVDSTPSVYVTDETSNLVRKYNATGTAGITWSTTGNPLAIGIDSGNAVYVLDDDNDLVRKYTNTGTAGITWSVDSDSVNMAVAPDGSVYVVTDPDDNQIAKYTGLGAAGSPANFSAATFPEQTIYATNSTVYLSGLEAEVRHYTTAGVEATTTSISPALANGIAVTSGGTLLVGDVSNKTIHTFGTTVASVGTVTVTPAATPVDFYQVASVTLTITEAWLIHPGQPTLSVSIDAGTWRDTGLNVDPASSQQNNAEAAITLHSPIGRTRTVAIAHGNRLEETWPLVLLSPTIADRDAVRAIIRDQTPLLLRSPASFGWDLTDGYYSVQAVQFDRLTANLKDTYRRITLPLIPSDPPVVRIGDDRDWSDVVEENEDWASVVLKYDTWTDLVLGTT